MEFVDVCSPLIMPWAQEENWTVHIYPPGKEDWAAWYPTPVGLTSLFKEYVQLHVFSYSTSFTDWCGSAAQISLRKSTSYGLKIQTAFAVHEPGCKSSSLIICNFRVLLIYEPTLKLSSYVISVLTAVPKYCHEKCIKWKCNAPAIAVSFSPMM